MGDLDGVTCFCELAMPLAARLCERLGLASNSPAALASDGPRAGCRLLATKDSHADSAESLQSSPLASLLLSGTGNTVLMGLSFSK